MLDGVGAVQNLHTATQTHPASELLGRTLTHESRVLLGLLPVRQILHAATTGTRCANAHISS